MRGRTAALEALQARIEVEVEVALPLLDLLVLVRQHLDAAAQARDLCVQALDLAKQVDDAQAAHALLEAGNALGCLARGLLLRGARVLDALARLVVVEEPGVGGAGGECHRRHREADATRRHT